MAMLQAEVVEQGGDVVGTSPTRIDAVPKVTGTAIYSRDMRLSRMLYARIKRSPFPHARVMKIDAAPAFKAPGLRAVITGADFPRSITSETPPLARGEVLYHNQAVAAVAAETPMAADRAVEALDVVYEPLTAVFDAATAMSAATPSVIHHQDEKSETPNVSKHLKVRKGDLQRALSKADVVVENTYSSALESHFQLEPLTFLAQPDADGGVTIWCTTTGPHKIRQEVAAYLGMDPNLIRAKVPFLGGWFGSKEESHVAAICAMLALKSRRAVRLALSREETMTASGVRHPSTITIKDAVAADGRILGRRITAVYEGGAYSTLGNELLKNSILTAVSVYDLENLEIDSYRVHTNRVPGTAKRDPIGFQMIWAVECQMDAIADRLHLDPVEVRLSNALRQGDKNAIGEVMESIDPELCLRGVAKALGLGSGNQAAGPWRQGKGVALAAKWALAGPHQAMVKVRETGKVEVWAAVVENGGGSTTGIAQIVATEFGIPLSDVMMMSLHYGSDSLSMGVAMGASGARQVVHLGRAVQLACSDAKRRIIERASARLGTLPEDLEVAGGAVHSVSDRARSIKISDLFQRSGMFASSVYYLEEMGFVGYGTDAETTGHLDPDTGECKGGRASPYYSDSAQAAEVWVNVETGRVRVKKITAALDVGKAMNPLLVKNQIIGGVMTGVSGAMTEELVLSDGKISNANLADYKLVSAVDAPDVETIIVELPFKDGPFGAKEGGEGATLPTAAAIRNAIHDATGAWVNDLPITPERVLEAIDRAGRGDG